MQEASRPQLNDRALQMASFREDETVTVKERLRQDRLDFRALHRRGGIKRRDQQSVYQTPRRRSLPDRRQQLRCRRLATEVERFLKLGKIDGPRRDILRTSRKLVVCISFEAVALCVVFG